MWEIIAAGILFVFSVFCFLKHYRIVKNRSLNTFNRHKNKGA